MGDDRDTEYAGVDFSARLEAEKAALVAEDDLRIRMAALNAAAEVARETVTEPTEAPDDSDVIVGDKPGSRVTRIAVRFERYLRTGETD